jgi:hypothetical protein
MYLYLTLGLYFMLWNAFDKTAKLDFPFQCASGYILIDANQSWFRDILQFKPLISYVIEEHSAFS